MGEKKKLLDIVREKIRFKHYSIKISKLRHSELDPESLAVVSVL